MLRVCFSYIENNIGQVCIAEFMLFYVAQVDDEGYADRKYVAKVNKEG